MDIIVSDFGSFIGRKSERLVIKGNGKVKDEFPFYKVDHILVTSKGVSLSSDAIKECVVSGIPITFLSSDGKPYAMIQSPHLQGTVLTRREQILAYNDERGANLAKQFASGKIANQTNLLKYISKYRKVANPDAHERLWSSISALELLRKQLDAQRIIDIDKQRETVLNIEGRASAIYWLAIASILPERYGFATRIKRGAGDLVNSLLNYGYGILYSQITVAIMLAGLDPYAGFLHTDRSGKPSLVLDLIEEFRQPIVDKTIIGMLGKNVNWKIAEGKLDDNTRLDLAKRVIERLQSRETYERKKFTLKTIIQRQARRVAMFVRNEKPYRPYVSSW